MSLEPSTGSDCCPCPDLVNCSCNSVCALECRKKEGEAALCGFEEFTDPSLPPKKYLRKELGALADQREFDVCQHYENEDCEAAECPGNVSFNWQGQIGGSPKYYRFQGTLTLQGVLAGMATYLADFVAEEADAESGPWTPVAGKIAGFDGVSSSFELDDGATVDLPVDTEYQVNARVFFLIFNTVETKCMTTGVEDPEGFRDHWETVEVYDPDDECTLTQPTFEKHRREAEIDTGCPDEDCTNCQDEDVLDCVNPPLCYGDGADVTTEPTTRSTQGVGCRDNGDGTWTNYTGTIVEELSEEDTEEDAMERATAEDEWENVESCILSPAFATARGAGQFSFAFRMLQVRVRLMGLAASTSYTVSVKFYRRVLGTSGPYLFFAQEDIGITTDANPASDDFTPWIDVPNESGWETRPQLCSVEPA